jgi:hypothetical protein
MWEQVADEVVEMGGEILRDREVRRLEVAGDTIVAVEAVDALTG